MTDKKKSIAFIGIGVMGRSMVVHLLKAGHHVTVYSRTKTPKTEEVIAAGAHWADSVAAAVSNGKEIVCTMVGFPKDVEEVYFGPSGIIENVSTGTLMIDFTTTKPVLAQRIAEAAKVKGLHFVDAPVSGGDVGARNAQLTIMVGGDQASFDLAVPVFGVLGKSWILQGAAGAGQHCKMCNQIAIAAGMVAVMESLLYAKRAGLDPETVLRSISSGAAASWSLANYVPRVLAGNFQPGFYVAHFLKDLEIVLEESRRMGLNMPGVELAYTLYKEVAAMPGGAQLGTQSIFLALEKRSIQKL